MALAEAAQLVVELNLAGNLDAGMAAASAKLDTLKVATAQAATGGVAVLGSAAGKVESAVGTMAGAIGTAAGKVKGLITGPLGFLGLAAATTGLVGVFKEGIDKANDMATAIETLGPLTGDTAEQVSALVAVFEKYGLSSDTTTTRIAFMEKAVGNLAATAGAAKKFQDEFGFSIVDASGKVKDANTILEDAADYWTSNASATQKAALEAKLFGRGFADMIPILNLGGQGIRDAEQAAADLGLTLTATNVNDLQQYQGAVRSLQEAMSGLELQVGMALIPTLRDLARNITTFVTTNRTNIVQFFQDAAKFAGQLAQVIGQTVIPFIRDIASAWGALPDPIKQLLIGGALLGKTTKFLFGINVPAELVKLGARWAGDFLVGIGKDVLGMAAGGAVAGTEIGGAMTAAGTAAGTTIGGAMVAAGTEAATEIGAAEAAGGGGGIFGSLGAAAAAAGGGLAGLIAAIKTGIGTMALPSAGTNLAAQAGLNAHPILTVNGVQYQYGGLSANTFTPLGSGLSPNDLQAARDNMSGLIAAIPGVGRATGEHAGATPASMAWENALSGMTNALKAATGWAGSFTKSLQDAEKATHTAFLQGTKDKNLGADADTLTAYFGSLSSSYFQKPGGTTYLDKNITRLQADQLAATKSGDTTLATRLGTDIAKLQDLKARIDALNAKVATTNATLSDINKKTPLSVTNNLYATLSVTVRDMQSNNIRSNLYGRAIAV